MLVALSRSDPGNPREAGIFVFSRPAGVRPTSTTPTTDIQVIAAETNYPTTSTTFLCAHQALQALEARSEEISAEADGLRANLRTTRQELDQSRERLRQAEGLRAKEAEKTREALDAARKALEEAEADGAERSRERSARAAGLQDVLREQGALLAERLG